MTPETVIAIVIGVIVLAFVVATVIILKVNKKRTAERENLFPTGADETEFTRQLQAKYREEGR